MRTIALFCLVAAAAAVPVAKDLSHASALVQSLAPVVQGAEDVKRMQLLSALRDTVLPLSDVIVTRLKRVEQFELNELKPLHEKAAAANHTIQALEQKINEVHAQLSQLPKHTHTLITDRDDALSRMDVANQTRTRVQEEGNEQLKTLQNQMDQARADVLLLNKLIEWIDTAAANWDDTQSLIEMKKLVAGLSSQFLAQLGNSTESSDLSTPALIKKHVQTLRDAARSQSETHQAAYSSLQTHMADKQKQLTTEIAQAEKVYNTAIAALSDAEHQERTLTDLFSSHSLELKEAQDEFATAQSGIKDVAAKWGFEKEELTSLKNTIQTILVLLPHA